MTMNTCTHEYLAASKFGKASFCRKCGVVHLHIQNLTLQLNVADFLGLADTLSEASYQVRAAQNGQSNPPGLAIVKSGHRLN
ncbi:MAG: hypothetical protein ACU84H_01585 [Gammaproteobacteria bacterium]